LKNLNQICEVQNVSQINYSRILWGFICLFIFGGIVFVVANNIVDWTYHGRGGVGLIVLSKLGVAIEKTVNFFFS
jgi:hypothetical protein